MKPHHFFQTLILLIMFGCSTQNTFAQHEYDVWYFGQMAGIDFTSGSPVVLSDGTTNTLEGTSSIADSAGSLLFYTDGLTVKNKNHVQMPNGFGLEGGQSSSQSALIIKQPGADSIYYIFTAGEWTTYGLNYSIVDMTLQNGLGDVTLKNVPLLSPGTEKLTAAKKSNGTDYWIITHGWNSNSFYAYEFSNTGVNATPIISSVGTANNGSTNNAIGYLRASHNGEHLALCVLVDNFFELFDFDNSTGSVSNPIHLDGVSPNYGPYGVEFSPNDSILYGSEDSPGLIIQWDISSGIAATINASRYVIDTTSSTYGGAIALASDGVLYMAEQNTEWLGGVQNPNVYGPGCNYIDHYLSLLPGNSLAGLPNIPPDWLAPSVSPLPSSGFAASSAAICEKFCISFFDSSLNNPTSWQWTFPGGSPSSSTDQNPGGICYDNPGTYDVTLITTNSYGSDTLTLSSYITVYATPPFPTITQAGYTLTSSAASSYQWQFNSYDIPGATNQSYTILQTGYYTVLISDVNGCVNSATIYVLISGVDDVDGTGGFSIYPNPATDGLMVEWLNACPAFCGSSVGDEISISLRNAIGQKIFSCEEKITAGWKKKIDLRGVAQGVYFVEIKTEDEFFRKKIIVAHREQ